MNYDEICSRIESAIASGNGTQFERAMYDLSTEMIYADCFPEEYFAFILKLFEQAKFLNMEGSHDLLVNLDIHWDLLSDDQRKLLLPYLERAYDKFKDWMSWFMISELLGEYFTNDDALQTLRRLKKTKEEGPRSFVPHALEHLVLQSSDKQLARNAFEELLQMKADPSERVRWEVARSLAIAAKNGYE